jgi:hypothetical protein
VTPHSASAASAIVKAMRSETSCCVRTCALAAPGTVIIAATAAAAAKRNDMIISSLVLSLERERRGRIGSSRCADYVILGPA